LGVLLLRKGRGRKEGKTGKERERIKRGGKEKGTKGEREEGKKRRGPSQLKFLAGWSLL